MIHGLDGFPPRRWVITRSRIHFEQNGMGDRI